MIENKPIRCDECGQIVGMLTKNARGSREEIVTGNDANCDYPPVVTCPDASTILERASVAYAARPHSGRPLEYQLSRFSCVCNSDMPL